MSQSPGTAALENRLLSEGYLRPTYADYGVANVPDTVAQVLGADAPRPLPSPAVDPALAAASTPIEHVVALVIDGLGWNRFASLRGSLPALDAIARAGTVTPLTSTYPSETAAAMVTLMTGLQPVEHGQLGWFSLFPEHDVVSLPLPFTTRDGRPLDEAHGVAPTDLFDVSARRPLVDRLAGADVPSSFVLPAELVDSPATHLATGSASRVGYERVASGLDRVRTTIEEASHRTFHQVYYPAVDAAAHRDGSRSAAYRSALEHVVRALEGALLRPLGSSTAERTLLLVLADHGIVDTEPARNHDLGLLDAGGRIALDQHLRRDGEGRRRYPTGSPRNVQFHTKPGHASALAAELESAVSARTYTADAYREAGLFGDRPPSERFERRAPDLVAVPAERGLWYDDGELDMVGMHGGLHPDEMLVPFLAARVGAIDG